MRMQGLPPSLFRATEDWSPRPCLLEVCWMLILVDFCGLNLTFIIDKTYSAKCMHKSNEIRGLPGISED